MRKPISEKPGVGPTNPAAEGFGEALRSARQRRHRSQAEVAELIDGAGSYISRLETGSRSPSRRLVARIVSALRMGEAEAAVLYGAAGYAAAPGTAAGEVAALAALLDDPLVPRREREAAQGVISQMVVRLARQKIVTPRIAGRQHVGGR